MKVTVSGYYGFGNTGDEAIALAITRELRKYGAQPLLLSNTPEETARTYACDSEARMQPTALSTVQARVHAITSIMPAPSQRGTRRAASRAATRCRPWRMATPRASPDPRPGSACS